MGENFVTNDKSDDLRYELKKLKMDLERSDAEKADAAEYGLVILEEKNMLKSMLEQKETVLENVRAQLTCAHEALTAMQQHNKVLEEADMIEEEKRMTYEEKVKKEREELENELRNYRKQLLQSGEEKDKIEEILKQSHMQNEKLKFQLKNLKEDLKECESREIYVLKNCDVLESDNVELQQQVSQLLKSLQHFEVFQSENKRLVEKIEQLTNELERFEVVKKGMEGSLRETNESLKDEREMKMRYKRELDARVLSDEGSCLDASTVASLHSFLGGPSSVVGDFSIDNISALLDGFIDLDEDENKETKRDESFNDVVKGDHGCLSDSLEDLKQDQHDNKINNNSNNSNNNNNKKKKRKKISKDLMSELMMSHVDYMENMEELEMENLKLNKTIGDLKTALKSFETEAAHGTGEAKTQFQLDTSATEAAGSLSSPSPTTIVTTSTEVQTGEDKCSGDEEEKEVEDAMKCLQNIRRNLMDMVTEAQTTYMDLCNAADESLNSKAMEHVEARKSSVEVSISHHLSKGNSDRRIPSFMLSTSLPKSRDKSEETSGSSSTLEMESVGNVEVDCTKLLASSIDLMRYSRRVANRMSDSKMAARTRESSSSPMSSMLSFTSSLSSSTNGLSLAHNTPSKSSTIFELQEQVFQLQSLIAAKTEQMMSLRQMLSANKSVYESSIDKLKQQHEDEMVIKSRLIDELKRNVDELKDREGMKFVSEQSLIKRCDNFHCQMTDLNERLTSSELERKTLNSLLRIAIQHKLLLLKKLQSHGISVDLFAEQDHPSDKEPAASQSDSRRFNYPSPRQPMGSRFTSSSSYQHRQPSFSPLLYSPSNHK